MFPTTSIHIPSSVQAGEAVRLARLAEEEGIRRVWLSEDLFFRGAIPTAGAIAEATSRISIGFGVLTPFSRHPSLIAMDLSTLLELAGDRIILGLGAGVKARVDRTMVEYRQPLAAMYESVEIIRGMLAGDVVTLRGEVHSADSLSLDVARSWGDVPIYLASTGPKSLRQTGQIADGLVLTLMSSLAHIDWATSEANEAARGAGRSNPIPAVVYMPLSVDQDRETAIERLKPTIAFYISRWAHIPTLAELFVKWGPLDRELLEDLAAQLEDGVAPTDVISDDLVTEYCVAGTRDDCVQKLEQLAAAGVSEVAFDIGESTRDIEAFARDVIGLSNETQTTMKG